MAVFVHCNKRLFDSEAQRDFKDHPDQGYWVFWGFMGT